MARLAAGPPLSYAATKKAVNAATLGHLHDALERERTGQTMLLRTDDVAEGMRAFGEKRAPVHRGVTRFQGMSRHLSLPRVKFPWEAKDSLHPLVTVAELSRSGGPRRRPSRARAAPA